MARNGKLEERFVNARQRFSEEVSKIGQELQQVLENLDDGTYDDEFTPEDDMQEFWDAQSDADTELDKVQDAISRLE